MGTYATRFDIELEWGKSVPTESAPQVEWMIDKAETVLAALVPGLADRVEAGRVTSGQLRHVIAAMVVRVLRNPEGKRSETAGDYSYELSGGQDAPSGMYLTAAERRLLGVPGRAGSIPLVDFALRRPHREPPECWDEHWSGNGPTYWRYR